MPIAYTPPRRWMREMAAHVQVEPQRISFDSGQLRDRGHLVGPSPALCPHLAQAVGSPVGAIATLRAAATPHWAELPQGSSKNALPISQRKKCQSALNRLALPSPGLSVAQG